MKPKHQRLLFIIASMVFLCVGGLFALSSFRDNLVFFYSPSDIQKNSSQTANSINTKTIRVGGLVKAGSIKHLGTNSIEFTITDGVADVQVSYTGLLPNLFREGQGCIAEGKINETGSFVADKILAKHDEKYMPREVVDALKRSGNWHGDGKTGEERQ